jgi:hypothetical protein
VPKRPLMAAQDVLLGDAIFSVPRHLVLKNCKTFPDNPDLLNSPYRVRSAVGGNAFRGFLRQLTTPPRAHRENVIKFFSFARSSVLRRFCRKFRISSRSMQLSTRKSTRAFAALRSKTYNKIERFLSCRRRFRICERRNRMGRVATDRFVRS